MPEYIVTAKAIVHRVYIIVADSKESATEIVENGDGGEPVEETETWETVTDIHELSKEVNE